MSTKGDDFLKNLRKALSVPAPIRQQAQTRGDEHLIRAAKRMSEVKRRFARAVRSDQDAVGLVLVSATGGLEQLAQWCLCRYGSRVDSDLEGDGEFILWLLRQYQLLEYVAPEDEEIVTRPDRRFFRKLVEYLARRFPQRIPKELVSDFTDKNSRLRAPFAHGDPVKLSQADILRYAASVACLMMLVVAEQIIFCARAGVLLLELDYDSEAFWWFKRMDWLEDMMALAHLHKIVECHGRWIDRHRVT